MDLSAIGPDPLLLLIAVALDVMLGDPVYGAHPVRLIGALLARGERGLRAWRADGYGGGIVLFGVVAAPAVAIGSGAVIASSHLSRVAGQIVHVFLLYSLLALGDLVHHVWRIERAVRADDLDGARRAVAALVGRDTDRLDGAACRRAGVESLGENLADGFVSPLCWYVVGGVPGLILFKAVSTMDSMVGYKTPRYLRFGWCGARLDDLMNYLPARLTWMAVVVVSFMLPQCSGRKAWVVGVEQHATLPGPNAGWSEAAFAGALQRRLVGPIWRAGVRVTDLWLGEAEDPILASDEDLERALWLAGAVGLLTAAVACGVMWVT